MLRMESSATCFVFSVFLDRLKAQHQTNKRNKEKGKTMYAFATFTYSDGYVSVNPCENAKQVADLIEYNVTNDGLVSVLIELNQL